MRNADDHTNDEEQQATIPTDYRTLLAITRPLTVAEHGLPSWRGGEVWRSGFGIFSGPGDWRPEFILKRGEIFRSHESGDEVVEDEEFTTTPEEAGVSSAPEVEGATAEPISAPRRRDSDLQIRICIGMS
jgi:hypothetical protein